MLYAYNLFALKLFTRGSWAHPDSLEVLRVAAHGVSAGSMRVVAGGRALAGVTHVLVCDVSTVGPTIISIVVILGVGRTLLAWLALEADVLLPVAGIPLAVASATLSVLSLWGLVGWRRLVLLVLLLHRRRLELLLARNPRICRSGGWLPWGRRWLLPGGWLGCCVRWLLGWPSIAVSVSAVASGAVAVLICWRRWRGCQVH